MVKIYGKSWESRHEAKLEKLRARSGKEERRAELRKEIEDEEKKIEKFRNTGKIGFGHKLARGLQKASAGMEKVSKESRAASEGIFGGFNYEPPQMGGNFGTPQKKHRKRNKKSNQNKRPVINF